MRKVTHESLPYCLRLEDKNSARERAKKLEFLIGAVLDLRSSIEDENACEALEAGLDQVIDLHRDLLEAAEGHNVLPFSEPPFVIHNGKVLFPSNGLSLRQVLDAGFAVLEVTEKQRSSEGEANA